MNSKDIKSGPIVKFNPNFIEFVIEVLRNIIVCSSIQKDSFLS